MAQREVAAAASQLTGTEQVQYSADPSARVRLVLARRSDLLGSVAAVLASDVSRKVRAAVAENPTTPTNILVTLTGDPDFFVRWAATQNAALDSVVHLAALCGTYSDTAEAVGQLGDQLAADVVEAVLAHPRAQARERLAEATSLPEVLGRLAVDPAPPVRSAAAQSDHIGEALLRQLADDPQAEVRAAVAAARRAPRDLVETLAVDRSATVRFWVSASPHYDEQLAAPQSDDPDEHIRRHARHRITGLMEA